MESHLVDLRAQNAELIAYGNVSGSDRMQSALAAALRLASMLSSNQTQDTIQQAMAVLDSVNKKLYGMIDQAGADASKSDRQHSAEVEPTTTSLDRVRGYGDDDDDDFAAASHGYGGHPQSSTKRSTSPTRPSGLGTSSQQRPAAAPSKRFRFGL